MSAFGPRANLFGGMSAFRGRPGPGPTAGTEAMRTAKAHGMSHG